MADGPAHKLGFFTSNELVRCGTLSQNGADPSKASKATLMITIGIDSGAKKPASNSWVSYSSDQYFQRLG